MDDASKGRPGRKRSEQSRAAVLEAALKVLREQGYAALSIEAIARDAGVGKQTIYRWWTSKASVVLEALIAQAPTPLVPPLHGSLGEVLEAFLASTFQTLKNPRGTGDILRGLMAEAQLDAQFATEFRTGLIEKRRELLRSVLAQAQERGELAADADLFLLVDMAFGVMWYRLLVGHAPLDRALAHELATLLLRAGAPSGPRRAPRPTKT
ncbi:TetR/AcrR family transcriptional regulator [Myxococcaceae bacterium JPH2]|nr:TetR/AcrR family transcriptional regulator [Myxococcaceae bacterium JPH2]